MGAGGKGGGRPVTCSFEAHQHWVLDEELLDGHQQRGPLVTPLVLSDHPGRHDTHQHTTEGSSAIISLTLATNNIILCM